MNQAAGIGCRVGWERGCQQYSTVKTSFFSTLFLSPLLLASYVMPTAPSYPFAYWYLPIFFILFLSDKGGRGTKNEIIDYGQGAEIVVIGVSSKEPLG